MSKLVSGPCCGKTHHTRWKFCKHPMIKRSQTAHDNTAFISGANSPTSAARPHKASETSFWAYLSPKPPTWVLHGAPWCSMVLHVLGTVQARGKWRENGILSWWIAMRFYQKMDTRIELLTPRRLWRFRNQQWPNKNAIDLKWPWCYRSSPILMRLSGCIASMLWRKLKVNACFDVAS